MADSKQLATADSFTLCASPRMLKTSIRLLLAVTLTLTAIGLAAWLWVTQPFVRAAPDRLTVRASPQRLLQDVRFLTELQPQRDADHPEQLRRVADYVRTVFETSGLTVEEQPYQARAFRDRTFVNVIGRLGPEGAPRVIVGAHYDVYGDSGRNPGADDNASGVAGLLELARVLSVDSAAGRLPVRVEFVAYSTEEPPFFATPDMGSAVHARSLVATGSQAPANDVVAMICLEMIGYYTERQPPSSLLVRTLYPSRGDFALVVGRPSDRGLAIWLRRGLAARGEIDARSYVGPAILGADLSDHRNYWAVGIPAVMVSDTAFLRNPNYHTDGDTAETLDYERMGSVVDGIANALLAGAPGE